MKSNLYALTLLTVLFATNSLMPVASVKMVGPRRIKEAWALFPQARSDIFSPASKAAGVSQRFYEGIKDNNTARIAAQVLHVKVYSDQKADSKRMSESYDAYVKKVQEMYNRELAQRAHLKRSDPEVYKELERILTNAYKILTTK